MIDVIIIHSYGLEFYASGRWKPRWMILRNNSKYGKNMKELQKVKGGWSEQMSELKVLIKEMGERLHELDVKLKELYEFSDNIIRAIFWKVKKEAEASKWESDVILVEKR